jgi:hypothetical protein
MSQREQTPRPEGSAKRYVKPALEFYGTLRQLTATVADMGNSDGGGNAASDRTNPG